MDPTLTPDQWARVQSVFLGALEHPEDERVEYVESATNGDVALQRKVFSLLQAHESDGISPDPGAEPIPVFSEQGNYRILTKLGEGGMGAVYLAERSGAGFTQRVALKVVRSGLAGWGSAERLATERRILARLEHPGIARFIDAGTTDNGLPYVAMEYVEGIDVVAYCAREHCSTVRRLELFLEICDAVHYAHQQLVIHRDLKPSNTIVTPEGRAKLLDFGIAKALDPSVDPADTQTGAWCTPAYASPEQVRRESVTTLSDVYALGILLYELLAGQRPYEVSSSSPAEIERVVCEVPPTRPSLRDIPKDIARTLAGDLDTIIMKAIEKEPSRRYASAREFAEDVRRYLAHEPILARPPSLGYRASRFIRRHRVAVGAGGLAAVSLIVGTILAVGQARMAAEERDRAQVASRQAEAVSDFLIDLFEASNVEQNVEPAREILTRGVQQAEALSGQPMAQAQMFDALGRAYAKLLEYHTAGSLLTSAYELRRTLYPEGHPDLARTMFALGQVEAARGLRNRSMTLLQESLHMAREHLGEQHPFAVGPLRALARALTGTDPDSAEVLHLDAMAVVRATGGDDDPLLADIMVDLGHLKRRHFDTTAAMRHFEEAVEHRRRTAAGPDSSRLATTMLHYGDFFQDFLSNPARAIPIYREALGLLERSLGPGDTRLIHALNSLGFALAKVGEFDEAERAVRRSVRIQEDVFGYYHIGSAREREQLAGVLMRVGKVEEAAEIYADAITVKRELLGESTVAGTYVSLSQALRALGRLDDAISAAIDGLEIRQRTAPDSARLGEHYLFIADLYQQTGNTTEFDRWLERARAATRPLVPSHPVRQAVDSVITAGLNPDG